AINFRRIRLATALRQRAAPQPLPLLIFIAGVLDAVAPTGGISKRRRSERKSTNLSQKTGISVCRRRNQPCDPRTSRLGAASDCQFPKPLISFQATPSRPAWADAGFHR